MKKQICVIGAGPAGLCAIRNIADHPSKFDGVVFERASAIGGIWRSNGTDHAVERFPSPLYKNLRMNTPKIATEYMDFKWSSDVPAYPSRADAMSYIWNYTDHFSLWKYIQCNTQVLNIQPLHPANKLNPKWIVRAKCLEDNTILIHTYDVVLICTGREMKPHIPNIPTLAVFKGKTITAADYLEPDTFQDQNVVVLGANLSGLDITVDLSPFAKKIILSGNRRPVDPILPSNVTLAARIKTVLENGFIFEDDVTCNDVDALIICTGYEFEYPFLDPSCGIVLENGKHIRQLYHHMVNVKFRTMCFIGVTYNSPIFYKVNVQVKWLMAYLKGELCLPSEDDIILKLGREAEERTALGVKYVHDIKLIQWSYYERLAKEGGFQTNHHTFQADFAMSVQRFFEDPANYRNPAKALVERSSNPNGMISKL